MQLLKRELDEQDRKRDRLCEAVENGFIPLDGGLQERLHRLQARRQELLVGIANIKRKKELPLGQLGRKNISRFCSALREKLRDPKLRKRVSAAAGR